jgi:two-component system, cell cycle response regulator
MGPDSIKLLLIEDNPGDARLVQEELSGEMSFDITTVGSFSEAVIKITDTAVDIILLDLSLPDSNGIDTFLKLNEHTKNIPIVILSGTKDENLAFKAVSQGAQDYLVKGEIDTRLLIRVIHYAIERHKVYKELEACKAELERYKSLDEQKVEQV